MSVSLLLLLLLLLVVPLSLALGVTLTTWKRTAELRVKHGLTSWSARRTCTQWE